MTDVFTRPQHQSRRSANGMAGVVVREPQSFRSQFVDVGRLDDFLAVATEIAVPQIVAHDVNDVGTIGFGSDSLVREEKRSESERSKCLEDPHLRSVYFG